MKKLTVIFISAVMMLLFSVQASGETLEGVLGELYDELPKEARELLPKELYENIEKGDNLSASESISAGFIIKKITSGISEALKLSLQPLFSLIGTIILVALLGYVGVAIGGGGETALGFVGGLSLVATIIGVLTPIWGLMYDTLLGIGLIIKSSLPTMTTIYAFSGNVSAAAVNSTWFTLLLTLLEQLCEVIISPLFYICCGFLMVTSLSRYSGAPDMSGVVTSMKKLLVLMLGLVTALFTAIMSYQTVVAKSADTMTLRSIKFASGNIIPIIGGALGEAADTFLSSVSVIRGTAGMITAVSLIIYVLPVILKIIVSKFCFNIAMVTASVFGCKKEAEILNEASGILEIALAIVSVSSIIFIIIIGIFAKSFI